MNLYQKKASKMVCWSIPHYTRPREWQNMSIPDVLLSGDHGRIAKWRKEQSERLTRERRPDLWKKYTK